MKAAPIYGRLGWSLIPIRPGGKIPLIQDWVNAASSDPNQLAEWAEEFPGANLGVVTGDSFFVLDVDPRNGGVAPEGLPETVQAATPSGGAHYLFKMVPGLTNSAGKLGPGLDIRAKGGQIVIAPSRTPAGQYRWIRAPWDHEIAEAPGWLLERLKPTTTPSIAPTERGFFGPATPEVLEAAADALEQHGPAIEGNGGDNHTFRAAALLIHDFALTDAEAWPLLAEWNATCEPPWADDDLRAKLEGGGKYGKLEYGCKRPLDCLEAAAREIKTWQQSGGAVPALMLRLRAIASRSTDPTVTALIVRDVIAATGLKIRDLGIPKAKLPRVELKQGEILVTTELHKVANLAIKAIDPLVYQRCGVLCEVTPSMVIHELDGPRLQDLMSEAAKFVHDDGKGETKAMLPPAPVAAVLQSRRDHPVRELKSVTSAPIFLADGSILCERGYNAGAQVFLNPSVEVTVADAPTLGDARAAIETLSDLVCDYTFLTPADLSAWIAAILTALSKAALNNAPAPLFLVSASSPGVGKSLLTEVIAQIIMGEAVRSRTYKPKDSGEWVKSVTTFVREGTPVSVFDDAAGAVGDETLDRLITSSIWSDRILGASEAPPLPNVSTWFVTGNNLEPVGATIRRCLMVRLQTDLENPQERQGFKYPDLPGHAHAHRGELLEAALTILRAYHLAGRPDQALPPWGSFTAWSALVRGALVWAGCSDPYETQRRVMADSAQPETETHDFWLGILGECPDGLPASVVGLANNRGASDVLGNRETLTPRSLRWFLGRFIDKPRAGKRIKRDGSRYWVESV